MPLNYPIWVWNLLADTVTDINVLLLASIFLSYIPPLPTFFTGNLKHTPTPICLGWECAM